MMKLGWMVAAAGALALSTFSAAVASAQAAAPGRASYTQAQADSGYVVFESTCASCHGSDLSGATASPLMGAPFRYNWDGKFTNALITHIRQNEPNSKPGTTDEATATLLVAYILSVNGVAAGDVPLSLANRAIIVIPPPQR